jgi:pimeloyl-ACP methyl ester carboxylesterase
VLEPLVDYWLEHYDWRSQETVFNRELPQFRTTITLAGKDPTRVHFVHRRSNNPKAVPLLFCHGWPGSILEVSKLIALLTEAPLPAVDSGVESGDAGGAPPTSLPVPPPTAYTDQLSFHVVVPSIPGFGFSDASVEETFGLRGTADLFDALMKQLGYDEYVAHGADW